MPIYARVTSLVSCVALRDTRSRNHKQQQHRDELTYGEIEEDAFLGLLHRYGARRPGEKLRFYDLGVLTPPLTTSACMVAVRDADMGKLGWDRMCQQARFLALTAVIVFGWRSRV